MSDLYQRGTCSSPNQPPHAHTHPLQSRHGGTSRSLLHKVTSHAQGHRQRSLCCIVTQARATAHHPVQIILFCEDVQTKNYHANQLPLFRTQIEGSRDEFCINVTRVVRLHMHRMANAYIIPIRLASSRDTSTFLPLRLSVNDVNLPHHLSCD